tara:strand:+ start:1370 stop:1534 length:165 start_codon:yes stop_codon:yes gene_type:complete
MKFELKLQNLGKQENRNEEKDMYQLTFKTYNSTVEGRFEKSEIRHIIEILDNAI